MTRSSSRTDARTLENWVMALTMRWVLGQVVSDGYISSFDVRFCGPEDVIDIYRDRVGSGRFGKPYFIGDSKESFPESSPILSLLTLPSQPFTHISVTAPTSQDITGTASPIPLIVVIPHPG
ncbi:hypothetical protein V6N13_071004 [Hibiscus sabdariffa]